MKWRSCISVGHRHPKVIPAIEAQLGKLPDREGELGRLG
jgi:hypothetical protein